MEVNISVQGLDKTQEALQTLKDKVQNTAPLMAELSKYLYNIVEESFENESSPDGKKWSPIKQTGRVKKGGSQKILFKSGDMQDSLGKDSSNDTAEIGLNAISGDFQYPLTHQFGTDKAGRNRNITIEARPFMPIKNDGSLYDGVEDELVDIIDDYIEDSIK